MFNEGTENNLDVTTINQKMNERKGRKKRKSHRKTNRHMTVVQDIFTDRVFITGYTYFWENMNIDKICR